MKLRRGALLMIVLAGCCANWVAAAEPMRLWEGDAPGALGKADHDIPTLTPFLPAADKASEVSERLQAEGEQVVTLGRLMPRLDQGVVFKGTLAL